MDVTVPDDADESGDRSTPDSSATDPSAGDRRGRFARLGALAGVASIAGCSDDGDSDGDQSDDDSGTGGSTEDAEDGTDDGDAPSDDDSTANDDQPTDDDASDSTDPERRAVELRAILKEFDDAYDQSVLDRAEDVRQQFRDSVVFVDLEAEPVPHRLATGWFVGDGQVVTTGRKLGTLDSVSVHTVDGDQHDARIAERHENENLALLELDARRPPIPRSAAIASRPDPNQPLVQIGHHDEYGHWIATVGDCLRTQTFGARTELIDEHWSNVPGLPGVGGSPVFTLDGAFVGMTNGAVPRERVESAPQPLNDYVYDWQMSHREWLNHLDAEQTFAEIDPWL